MHCPVEAVCASVLQQVVALHVSDLCNIPVMSQPLSSLLPSTSQVLRDCVSTQEIAWGILRSSYVESVFMLHLISNVQ